MALRTVFGAHSRVSPASSVIAGSMTKIMEGRPGVRAAPAFTSRPLMQPFNPLSNRRHVAVPTIPDGLPDLVGHVGYLGARADAAIPAMNDHLTWLGRIFEASSVPLRQELFSSTRVISTGSV